jgi:hypothetical protein
MRRRVLTAAALTAVLAAALAAPTGGVASIPPSYRIVVVSDDVQARARADALVQYMSAQEAFLRAEPTVWRHTFEPCLTATTPWENCVPAKLPLQAHWQDPPHVVIRAEAESREVLTLTCIRAGTEAAGPPRRGRVDALTAIFGEGEARTAALRAAMDCIGGG